MASLTELPNLVGFFSYSRNDDEGMNTAAMRFPPNRNACGIRFRQTADIHTAKGSYVANNGVRATYSSPHHHCGSS
jgi:hypothetical protein